MIKQSAKDAMERLDLEYCPVAVKFCFNRPDGYELLETDKPICHHVKNVQELKKTYYIELATEGCLGKRVLGAEPMVPFDESGAIGFHHGIYKQQSCNAKLYYEAEMFKEGTVNFVIFGPATEVDFDPDLLFFVAPTEQADIIMRAGTYSTGDLYESKASSVLGCHWLFNYPYRTGKINFVITGMHYGMKKANLYPAGLHMIVVPFNKFPAFFEGLEEMEWVLPAFQGTEESKEMMAKYYEKFDHAHDMEFPVDPKDRGRNA